MNWGRFYNEAKTQVKGFPYRCKRLRLLGLLPVLAATTAMAATDSGTKPVIEQRGYVGGKPHQSDEPIPDLLPLTDYVHKRDYRSEPFRCVAVLGESHVAAGKWQKVFAELLTKFQGQKPKMIKAGIGGSVVSRRSPGYRRSGKPSAVERFREDVIAHQPDLVIISYGLNDVRAGMPAEDFREELSYIVEETKKALDAVIVLTTVYNMSAYNVFPPYDKGSVPATEVYNLVIRQIAEKYDAVVADIWAAEGGAPWVISADTVHANDLGYTLIGNRVFEAVVTNCSGAAAAIRTPEQEVRRLVPELQKQAAERGKKRE